ncbi:hypothetical protein HAX54_008286, partial [Datura stramonium]|nr:hypothetical protein [Datura stramonium]
MPIDVDIGSSPVLIGDRQYARPRFMFFSEAAIHQWGSPMIEASTQFPYSYWRTDWRSAEPSPPFADVSP